MGRQAGREVAEDTPEADLRVAIEAYGRTVEATLEAVSNERWRVL